MADTFYSESDKKELVELYVIYQSYQKVADKFIRNHPNHAKKPGRSYVQFKHFLDQVIKF